MEQRQNAHANTCVGKLLKVAALALQQMRKVAWPSHFGNVSTPELWAEIHHFLHNNEHLHPERRLRFLNHDLVGFFNFIHFLTSEFLDNNNHVIVVDPHTKISPVHSGKSSYSVKSNMIKMQAQHIPAIIQFSFDACAFTAIGEVFQQTCGTSMGNQISPILSTCAIVATEITWLRMYGQFVSSAHLADQLWIRRYVDNRAILVDEEELHRNPHVQQLASLHFYKKPVQLEDENCDDSWASTSMQTTARSLTTCAPKHGDTDCHSRPGLRDFDSVDITADNTSLSPLRTLQKSQRSKLQTWKTCTAPLASKTTSATPDKTTGT